MPRTPGLERLRRLRAEPALAHPVIMLSGSGADENIERCSALGVDAYRVRPSGIYGPADVPGGLPLPRLLLPRQR